MRFGDSPELFLRVLEVLRVCRPQDLYLLSERLQPYMPITIPMKYGQLGEWSKLAGAVSAAWERYE